LKILIIGGGHLGRLVGLQCKSRGDQVQFVTKTTARHQGLVAEGFSVSTFHDFETTRPSSKSHPTDFDAGFVIVPPMDSGAYESLCTLMKIFVRGNWAQSSSTGVFETSDGEEMSDANNKIGADERARQLLSIEEQTAEAQGRVVRLAGLYDDTSGPHRVYAQREKSDLRPDGWINLIHYQDAAAFLVHALEALQPGERRLVSDGSPIQRSELARKAADWAAEAGLPNPVQCKFSGTSGARGNRYHPDFQAWGLAPKFKSFMNLD
jgi:hypothetical protein